MKNPPAKVDYTVTSTANLVSLGNGAYTAMSNDPSLLIQLSIHPEAIDDLDCHIRMKVIVDSDDDKITSELYFDTGSGYSQECSLTRSFASGEVQEYILHKRFMKGALRFDPHNRPGKLIIKHLSFYTWSTKASYTSLVRDFARRLSDPTKSSAVHSLNEAAGLTPTSGFEDAYIHYLNGDCEPVKNPYSLWSKYIEKTSLIRYDATTITKSDIKFSLLVPVYNTNPVHLRECVQSVISQKYQNWELCIADDNSSREETRNELHALAELDPRIKVHFREENGHICHATNDALSMATGNRICFLDHDDLLAPHALQAMANVIYNNPQLKLIYSDEDFLDLHGNRVSPHFKSDWNRHLLYSHNYITHFVCVDAELMNQVGGLRIGTEGSQDYDFLLRLSNILEDRQIFHIPEILYHWRISESSTAGSSDAKPYTVAAGKKALVDALQERGEDVRVDTHVQDNFYVVSWNFPDGVEPRVSIIIPTRNGLDLLKNCVTSIIEKTTYSNYEIIIVDNGSDDPEILEYFEYLNAEASNQAAIRVLRFDEPFNYSRINNFAAHHANGDLICLLNNDTEVIEPDWLRLLASHAARKEVGCVGAKLLYDDDTIQHAGIILSLGGYAGHSHKGLDNRSFGYFLRPHLTQEVSAVTGACLMVRAEVFHQVNGLDETLFSVAYNDVDFCLKVKDIGLKNIYVPQAVLYHYESKSRGYEDSPEKLIRFKREQVSLAKTWGHLLKEDFCYNPNLTKDREDFSLRVC